MTNVTDPSTHGVELLYDSFSSGPQLGRPPSALRTIHYLGSKLRLLQPIAEAVAQVAPPGARVCDLFAGSGTVSLYLSSIWKVLASDIQEYSRVLCNGLLNPPPTLGERTTVGQELVRQAKAGTLRDRLQYALAGILDHERICTAEAAGGDTDGLCGIMECPPLIAEDTKPSHGPLETLWRSARRGVAAGGLAQDVGSVVTTFFGGVYFSWRQAVDLDALLEQVHRLGTAQKDYYLACVLMAASEIVNTVGKHFAQRANPRKGSGEVKTPLVRSAVRDRSQDVFRAFLSSIDRLNVSLQHDMCHRAFREDFADLLGDRNLRFDAVYADPPYTRDHYSRYYHVLETMALHDRPDVSKSSIRSGGVARLSRGVYRRDRHQSPFCIHSRAEAAFHRLAGGVARRNVPLVLSYSPYKEDAGQRPRVLTAKGLLDILRSHFRAVDVREVPNIAHRKLNLIERNVAMSGTAELLMVCQQ